MHEDINLIIDYMDKRIEELNKLREDLKAQYDDLFPSTGKEECRNCEALDKSVVKATAFKLSKSNQLAFCKKAIIN